MFIVLSFVCLLKIYLLAWLIWVFGLVIVCYCTCFVWNFCNVAVLQLCLHLIGLVFDCVFARGRLVVVKLLFTCLGVAWLFAFVIDFVCL